MKKLGIIDSFYAAPLFNSLKDRKDSFELITGSPAQISKMLREKKLVAAFLSPIDYAKGHEGLHHITTIATDLTTISEMVLAKIVMIEKHSNVPQFIAATGGVQEMLQKAYAALIVGNANLELNPDYKNKFDLVDDLIQSARFGASHLTEIADLQPQSQHQDLVEYLYIGRRTSPILRCSIPLLAKSSHLHLPTVKI